MAGPDDKGGGHRLPLAATIAYQAGALSSDPTVPESELSGSLLVLAGEAADVGNHWAAGDAVTLGRDPANLVLRDGQTSRYHATVSRADEGWALTDLDSTNGTQLNGAPVHGMVPLRDGDRIGVGRTIIKFMLVDATEAAGLERLALLAGTDRLTGLIAKHRFDSLLAEGCRETIETGRPLSLLMLDMDGLKAINTAHGHQMGAHTIAEVGKMIGGLVGHHGESCRFGGDEFSVMLPGAPLSAAMMVGERIRKAVEAATFELGAGRSDPTISIGVATIGGSIGSVQELIAAADKALYRAKDKGRNTVSS
jgi:two-component system, cell cycle response regulator